MTGDGDVAEPRQRRALLRYQRSRDTRERLALEAIRLFRDRGFDNVTVEEICAAAGVSRSSYYFHFDNKDSVLGEIDGMSARRAGEELRAQAAKADTSLEAEVDVLVRGLARRARRLPKELLARAMARAMQGLPYVGQLPDEEADFGHVLAESFARSQERDEIPSVVNPNELAAVLAAMLMEGMLRWAHGTTPAGELEDALRWRAKTFLAGVRASA